MMSHSTVTTSDPRVRTLSRRKRSSSTHARKRTRHHLERRAGQLGGVAGQIGMVNTPDTPLPPFGRRESDIRPVRPAETRVQRVLDIAIASMVLLVASVPCVLLAIGIKITSRGPVLFAQDRVGRNGESFRIFKFRTMRTGTDAELSESAAERQMYVANSYKLDGDDPRITSLGRILRRTSLDELPQLVNVLKGQMSIVGIRPLVEDEYLARLQVDRDLYDRFRPGMTGLWQISGRSSVVRNQRVVLDRAFAAEWSVRGNVSILARTPATLLGSDSAY